jgi:hypothetical protein
MSKNMTFWQCLAGKVWKSRSKVSNFDSKVAVFWQLLPIFCFFNDCLVVEKSEIFLFYHGETEVTEIKN